MSGKRIHLSSVPVLMVEEDAKVTEKQGIVSILRSDSEQTKASSLRRTLSADMSSKKWLTQHGFSSFSPMKKIASSEELALSSLISSTADSSFSSSEEGEEDEEYELRKSKIEKPSQNDIWSLILSQKAEEDSSKLQPPYVHPLVKKSKSSLNEKSLQICTESLGSETGSEGFCSYPSSESGEGEEDKEEAQTQALEEKESRFLFDREESRVINYNYYTNKKLPLKSFPPPLPSLAHCEGPSLHMQSHRENGRLVLESVSVPPQNYFRARREDGRLLLSFANRPSEEPTLEETIDQREDEVEEIEEEYLFQNFEEEDEEEDYDDDDDDDDDEEEEEEEGEEMVEKIGGEEIGIMMEQEPKLSSGVINVHRSALMMKKLMGLDHRRNPTWPNKYNKSVNLVEMEVGVEEEEEGPTPTPLAQSLPRPPRVARLIPSPPATAAGAASFNAYEYFWRTKPTVATLINPITQQGPVGPNIKINKQYEQQEMVLLRGNKADYLVPLMKSCKETRRSLLIWEPYCIATS